MREETAETIVKLRSGYTTGACATATAYAAAYLLLSGKTLQHCSITLPKGQHVEFLIDRCFLKTSDDNIATAGDDLKTVASATTTKDAGDDPDVTHGATVFSTVELTPTPGVNFYSAEGVGTVTRPGLPIPAGQPAINPVPRQMIHNHLTQLAQNHAYNGGFNVSVGVENGKNLASKTMNPRLGIVNGLSILGTTGIVRPFSCSAYIASIQQGIDVALSNGESHLFACTGNKSEETAVRLFSKQNKPVNEIALIEMGDFIGAVLKHVKKISNSPPYTTSEAATPVSLKRLTIIGGFGKLSKFAQGNLDLHSKSSSIDLDFLAELASTLGTPGTACTQIKQSNTSIEALSIANDHCKGFADKLCKLGVDTATKYVQEAIHIDVIAIDKQSKVVGSWSSASRAIEGME